MLKKKKKKSVLGSTGTVSQDFDNEDEKVFENGDELINSYIRVVYIDPTELKPNPLNQQYFNPLPPDEYEALKKDIEERGLQDPLQVKNDNILLTGENRLKIALELKLSEIPVVYKGNPNKEKELDYILNDNILRRQLTPEEKKNIIKKRYGDKIFNHDERGGDRSKKKLKGKNSKPFAEEVSEGTGLPTGTVKRYLSEMRKEKKTGKENSPSSFYRLQKQIKITDKIIDRIIGELNPDEKKESISLLKQLTNKIKEF